MQINFKKMNKRAQTAVEYMLLLGSVVAIVLVGFKTYLPSFEETSNYYQNQVGIGILGEPSRCGDSFCDPGLDPRFPFEDREKCPQDC